MDTKDCIKLCEAVVASCKTCAYESRAMGGMDDCVRECDYSIAEAQRCIAYLNDGSLAMCVTCAESCERCASVCERYNHNFCRVCADACRQCASGCRVLSEDGSRTTVASRFLL